MATNTDLQTYLRRNASIADIPVNIRAEPLRKRLIAVLKGTWDLGLVSFGGPPVHFQIFHRRFVQREKHRWISENTYKELFAISQALPGPASTKLSFCITLTYAGVLPALLQFTLWCLPGALGMFAVALAIARMPDQLPVLVYALLSGLNAATVGVIAVSASILSKRVITDQLSRGLVIVAACAAIPYSAIWYFPVLMVAGGVVTLAWDSIVAWRTGQTSRTSSRKSRRSRRSIEEGRTTRADDAQSTPEIEEVPRTGENQTTGTETVHPPPYTEEPPEPPPTHYSSPRLGLAIIGSFLAVFITILVVRAVIRTPPVLYKMFSNLFLAGTIIFGGGPVVIPLLNQYIVEEGWVSSRDFLLGLAIIQAFPGPNFNFAVLLAVLTPTGVPSPIAALIGFLAIFSPGLVLAAGASAIWGSLRKNVYIRRILRGINAAAVGLVWTAVVRLWNAGYLRVESSTGETGLSVVEARGASLGEKSWWFVVAAVAYSGNRWYKFPPPVAIALGGAMGLAWAGVVI